ncbi:MAG: Stage V sporulation protein D [bacterium ADurb.Bin363]|nr:MAG: Stage V sporulation protein D [bacterium ADurb.Bin363]
MVPLFLILIFSLFETQVVKGNHYKELAFQQHLCHIPIAGTRGKILDRNGSILALSLQLYSIGVNPRLIDSPEKVAKQLSPVLSISEKELLEKMTFRGVEFIWIDRKVSDEIASKVKKLNIEGIYLLKEETGKRFYPNHNLACHIIGYTGIDDQGLDGIEAIYENYLTGKAGLLKAECDNFGRAIPQGKRELRPATDGCNLVLTIDKFIQYLAESELSKAIKKYKARSGTIIVMDPQTGEILALANYPNFDINKYTSTPKSVLRNRGVCDSYEPGSTFKIILAAAALDCGKVSMTDVFPCGNSMQVGGWTIYNANDGLASEFGYENIKDIIKYSFNTGSVGIGMKIGTNIYFDYIKKFGFGSLTGIELPGEGEGIVLNPEDWSVSSLATIAFGQGISVTPLQLVRSVAAISNGGKIMRPMLVKEILSSDGHVVKTFTPEVEDVILKPSTTEKIVTILEEVISDGTGKKAQIPGYSVAGKTGTAQIVDGGVYSANKYISSFVGFVPSRNPRLVMIVKIDEARGVYWGGYVAAPVFGEVGRESLWYMGVPSEKYIDKQDTALKKE